MLINYIVIKFEYLKNIILVIKFYVKFFILASFNLSNYILNYIYQIKNDKFTLLIDHIFGQLDQTMVVVVQPLA